MSSVSTHSTIPVVAEYDIDFAKPVTAPGIFPLLIDKVLVEEHKCHCQKVFIKVPNVDVADWYADLHSATLLPDRTGIEITVPILPWNERNRSDVEDTFTTAKNKKEMANDDDKDAYWYCSSVHFAQLEMIHQFESNDINLRQTIVYHFPKSMVCNNQFFNSEHDTHKLTPKIIVGKRKGSQPLVTYAVVYEMVVDGTVTRHGAKDPTKKRNIINDLLSGMSIN